MSGPTEAPELLYTPKSGEPMQIVFFASGGPGNLCAAFDVQDMLPGVLNVALVVTDRPNIPAIQVAHARGVPVLTWDFDASCGPLAARRDNPEALAAYRVRAQQLHDEICYELGCFEEQRGIRFDIAVLAYRRIIEGRLLERFAQKMINQHPADLSVLNSEGVRAYTGISGHARALNAGEGGSRTSTIVVRPGVDDGEILCQGPFVAYAGDGCRESIRRHEEVQKALSDWPALRFALAGIALGQFGLLKRRHPDGARVVCFAGQPQPYFGVYCNGRSFLDVESRFLSATATQIGPT